MEKIKANWCIFTLIREDSLNNYYSVKCEWYLTTYGNYTKSAYENFNDYIAQNYNI